MKDNYPPLSKALGNGIKLFITLAGSGLLAIIICQVKGRQWEEPLRQTIYRLQGRQLPLYARDTVDADGLPHSWNATQNGIPGGWQTNPTIVANYALEYYAQIPSQDSALAKRKFIHCARWLLQQLTYVDSGALYLFNWRQPWYPQVGQPFTSGMTSGRALQVFTRAHQLTKDTAYLKASRALLNGYTRPITAGGFTIMEPQGWWFEEIADTAGHTPRILDGHIYALMGVRDYDSLYPSPLAKAIFNQGLQSLKYYLPHYGAGTDTMYYDGYRLPADRKYKQIILTQMHWLTQATNDSLIRHTYYRWLSASEKPYLGTAIAERNKSGLILFGLCWVVLFIITWLGLSTLKFK